MLGNVANQPLSQPIDRLVQEALEQELERQRNNIELIASENSVSPAILAALGHPMSNKTLEGYPGRRFHGGGQFVDTVETAAIERAKQLFDANYANVQPHSGAQANQAVFVAFLSPGDTVMSLDLAAGGHLSHGAKPNMSGRWFNIQHYGVDRDTGRIDYDALAVQARDVNPKLLIAGGSSYPREIDFKRMSEIAKEVGALFLVDMAHIAGLVAGKAHPSPIPYADIVTCTTTKTLRGPRGGLIMSASEHIGKKIQSGVFPGAQGSLHANVIAAKAICFEEALDPSFQVYAKAVVENAQTMAATLIERGIDIVTGGTDTHKVLVDFRSKGLIGQQVEDALAQVNITSNKNPIPFDNPRPADWQGLRLGTAAATTRGLNREAVITLSHVIADVIDAVASKDATAFERAKKVVGDLCSAHPFY